MCKGSEREGGRESDRESLVEREREGERERERRVRVRLERENMRETYGKCRERESKEEDVRVGIRQGDCLKFEER